MILDKYRSKGYITVSSLTPGDRKELEELVSLDPEEQRQLGLELGSTLAHIVDPKQFIRVQGETVVAFRAGTPPPPPPPQAAFPSASMHLTTKRYIPLPVSRRLPTKEQQEEMVEHYKEELEKTGVSLEEEKPVEGRRWVNDPTRLRLLLTGQRNAIMVSERGAQTAKQWGLVTIKIPHGSFRSKQLSQNKAYIAYRPGESRNAKEIIGVLQKYPAGKRGIDYLREMGRATGTPAIETEAYITSLQRQIKQEGLKRTPGYPRTGTVILIGALVTGFLILRRADHA
jgi:hypothetical protein